MLHPSRVRLNVPRPRNWTDVAFRLAMVATPFRTWAHVPGSTRLIPDAYRCCFRRRRNMLVALRLIASPWSKVS